MVVIRLTRGGSKKTPFYHLVVADKRCPRDGRFIERVGYFDPMARGNATRLQIEKDRIAHWIAEGAQPSMRVNKLVKEFELAVAANLVATPTPTKAEMRREQAKVALEAAEKAKKADAKEQKAKADAEPKAEETAAAETTQEKGKEEAK